MTSPCSAVVGLAVVEDADAFGGGGCKVSGGRIGIGFTFPSVFGVTS